jgi:hypothetical protein
MAVKVKHHKGKWWVFIDHKGKRKAKHIDSSKRARRSQPENALLALNFSVCHVCL